MSVEQTGISRYRSGNPSSPNDYLEEIILLNSGEHGKVNFSEEDDGFEEVILNDGTVKDLDNAPENTGCATIQFEVNSGTPTDARKIVRFKENGSNPTASEGFVLGDGDILYVNGYDNIPKFKMIRTESSVEVKATVQYHASLKLDRYEPGS
jgi:hypothetical protein